MLLTNWLKPFLSRQFWSPRVSPSNRRQQKLLDRYRPVSYVERLEDRTLLSSFVVNVLADTVDVNPGDGLAQDAAGNTSLRAAVMESNALAGADTIILGTGTFTLAIAGTARTRRQPAIRTSPTQPAS
jgi:hypothetical protein